VANAAPLLQALWAQLGTARHSACDYPKADIEPTQVFLPGNEFKVYIPFLVEQLIGGFTMKLTTLLVALSLVTPGLALSADYGKLIDSVDKEKATDSVDTEKLKGSVDGTEIDYKEAYDSVDKEKAADSVDTDKVKEALAD